MKKAVTPFQTRLYSERARFIALVAFLALVFLLGGSSRHDIPGLIVLRPAAALFLAYALAGMTGDQWRALRAPFLLLAALAALIWVQLVPLPPSLWIGLPAREPIAAMGEALGMGDLWRPLTMSPAKTWNALFSLVVPAAALALFAILAPDDRRRTWSIILFIALISAGFGVLQILGGRAGTLYFYPFTPQGFASGLFANRNHQGVFLAAAMAIAAWQFASIAPRDPKAKLKGFLALAPLVLLIPMVFLTGSRAGLICAALAFVFALWMLSQAPLIPARIEVGRRRSVSRRTVLLLVALGSAALASIIIASSRALALDRMMDDQALEDLRWKIFPILQEMAADMIVWGSGFGAFEFVYKVYEPVELLGPKYLNNAHNDWLQFIIEGGLVGIIILVLFIAGAAMRGYQAWRGQAGDSQRRRLMAFAVVALFGVGSLVDYPLRTPSIMALFAIACATLWMARDPAQSAITEQAQRERH